MEKVVNANIVTTDYAYKRMQIGKAMPGVFQVSRKTPIGLVIEDVLLLADCSFENEWEGQVY